MIIGNGLLAREFERRRISDPRTVIFASGVSNSAETRSQAFERELNLLRSVLNETSARCAYFSSCALDSGTDADTPYMHHKRRMEQTVLATQSGIVFRLPQVVGRTENAHTLTNFLNACVRGDVPFDVWAGAERNIIDVEDVVSIVEHLLGADELKERVVSIAAKRSLPMKELVAIFEMVIGKKAHYTLIDAGTPLRIDSIIAQETAKRLGIDLGGEYAAKVIRKYYGPRSAD